MRRSFTDLNPGRECSIASSLSISGLEDEDSDRSNSDHGGIVLVDDEGRIYVDVVLHNRQDATDTPMDDAWEELTPSATYTLCLRKKPPWARRRSLDEAKRDPYEVDLAKRALQLEWWEQPVSVDEWIYIDGDWIHVRKRKLNPQHSHTYTLRK